MNEKLIFEPSKKYGWVRPKKGRDTGGTVFTVSFTALIDMLVKEGRLMGEDVEIVERIRVTEHGIDVFVDRAPRTIGDEKKR